MRVLHVDPERGWGGGEVQVLLLLRALAESGVSQRLAADPRGRLATEAAGAGIEIEPLRIANHADLRAGLRLRRLAREADVVHFHTARAHALAPFVRRACSRLVVTRRMDYPPRGGPYARYLYNRAVDAVIAISADVRRALLDAGVRTDRVRVVPSGVEAERFVAGAARAAQRLAWKVGPEDVLVVVVGALVARKGHAVLLTAAAQLAAELPRLRYVFCGAGPEAEALREQAHALGDRVYFAGFLPEVAPALAAADVVALPSLHEGLGVAALEAMAAGRPVIASAAGGLAEVVIAEETGLLVPAGDARALAAALARLARDTTLRGRLGAAGAARVRRHFTAAAMAEGTLACYEGR